MVEKVIIMGAAGRDFHNFNIYFRENPRYKVIGFNGHSDSGHRGTALSSGTGRQNVPGRDKNSCRRVSCGFDP